MGNYGGGEIMNESQFSDFIRKKPSEILSFINAMTQTERDNWFESLTEEQQKNLSLAISSEAQKAELLEKQDFSEDDYQNLKSCDF